MINRQFLLFIFQLQSAEDAIGAAIANDEKQTYDAATPAMASGEIEINNEQAPVATPSNDDNKSIIGAAKEMAIKTLVIALKSEDEKLHVVTNPEQNENAEQDLVAQVNSIDVEESTEPDVAIAGMVEPEQEPLPLHMTPLFPIYEHCEQVLTNFDNFRGLLNGGDLTTFENFL